MADNETKNPVGRWLGELNIPHLLAGPAGDAISRLVGGITDYPVAWLERASQAVKDGTEARKLVRNAVAQAAADAAAKDKALVERAMQTFIASETRKQNNKESVAKATIEHLSAGESQETTSPKPVDSDWMNVFERHAENASSERLQDIWGRVLAGEIRKPTTFSLRTLSFISQLDRKTAELFEKHSSAILGGWIIPYSQGDDTFYSIDELLHLEESGLLTGVGAHLSRFFGVPVPMRRLTLGKQELRLYTTQPGVKATITGLLLTQVGREIASILSPAPDPNIPKYVAKIISKDGLSSIAVVRSRQDNEEILWTNDPPTY